MSGKNLTPLRAGFIPLVDAAVLIAAADRGFAAEEGLALELVREVSWSNVRDKLNLGHFQAAHFLAPMAIAGTLGLDYGQVATTAPLALNLNGNAIVVTGAVHEALAALAEGDLADPRVSGAALKRLIHERRRRGDEPLTFGMTFPFSMHNYQLRFWMAAAGIDPDEDVRLVVHPPPYMVESLASGKVQGFCVGAPWPSLAVDAGLGTILHLGTDIVATCPEKVLAVRKDWAEEHPDRLMRLTRALIRAAAWCADRENLDELAALLTMPGRIEVAPELVLRVLRGRIKTAPAGGLRREPSYLIVGPQEILRPEPAHAAWLYAQMVRWGQAKFSPAEVRIAMAVYRPDLFDEALRSLSPSGARDAIGAFAGPAFDPADIPAHLAAWPIGARV